MPISNRWRGLALAGLAVCSVFASCGDDDGESQEEEDEPELDLIALVVDAFEQEPARLPAGFTLSNLYSGGHWDNEDLATVDFEFAGPDGGEGHAAAVIYRTDARARSELTTQAEGWAAAEIEGERGHYCTWDEFTIALNTDVTGVSICFARAGNVYVEVEVGEVPEDEPEAALELLQAMVRHFDRLEEGATDRVRVVPPEPLAQLLGALPAPGAGSIEFTGVALSTTAHEGSPPGLLSEIRWGGDPSTQEYAFANVFESADAADDYRAANLSVLPARGQTGCAIPQEEEFRYCAYQLEEVVVLVQRVPNPSTGATDPHLQGWVEAMADHVDGIRSGKLPRPMPEDAVRPPTAVPATPTPTPTPLPQVSRFNAGTWTFDMAVTSNNCPGNDPAVGYEFTLQFEFTDTNDGYIYPGEAFYIEQLLPGYYEVGAFAAALPTTKFGGAVAASGFEGVSVVNLTFVAENAALVDYTEEYGTCRITAKDI